MVLPSELRRIEMKPETVTRIEVIDEHGRAFVRQNVHVQLSRQDGGKTLKIFVQRPDLEGDE